MLGHVGQNHTIELSGPSGVDLAFMEDWTRNPKIVCFGYGCSISRNGATHVLLSHTVWYRITSLLTFEDLSQRATGGSSFVSGHRGGAEHSQQREEGNRDNMNEPDRLGYWSSELLQYLGVCKTKRNCFSCPAASTGNSHHKSHLSRMVNQRSPRPGSSILRITIPL